MATGRGWADGGLEKAERCASLAAALLAGAVFFSHLSPGVTLGVSGEVVTAAFTFGVPHPPGYPLWTLLGFLWSHLVLPFGNPAWRIGVLSAVMGATLVGVVALTTMRCARRLLAELPWARAGDPGMARWIAMTAGVGAALLFGFHRAVWYWACVPEPHAGSMLVRVSAGCALLLWALCPDRRKRLYGAVGLCGVSFVGHGYWGHLDIFLVAAVMAGAALVGLERWRHARRASPEAPAPLRHPFMPSLAPFWELCTAGLICAVPLLWVPYLVYDPHYHWRLGAGLLLISLLAIPIVTRWWSPRQAFALAATFLAGLAMNLYLPLAASTNPPMNWGYTANPLGFLHVIRGGCYVSPWEGMTWGRAGTVLNTVVASVVEPYSLLLALAGLMTLVLLAFDRRPEAGGSRTWLACLWILLLATLIGSVPGLLWQTMEKDAMLASLAPAHAFYALLIGLGLAVILSLVARHEGKGARIAVRWLGVGVLALPLLTYLRNEAACTQRGHEFGYRFGHLLFEPGYGVPPMEKDAILFAGTDAGRFVGTYMIFCESRARPEHRHGDGSFDRSDVYLIAQNALADTTYMSAIRDQYDVSRPANTGRVRRLLHRDHAYPKSPIMLPTPEEGQRAFQTYVEEMRAQHDPAGGGIETHYGGRTNLRSYGGVMAINGILARWIFEHNKAKHAFYVEESYVIPWMYPFLRPAGPLMRLEPQALPSPQADPRLWAEMVAQDRAYWDRLTDELEARPEYRRDTEAGKVFAKLRTAIAGLYDFRGMEAEAEYAFRQALRLSPDSREANFRLADRYLRARRYGDARAVMQDHVQRVRGDEQAADYLEVIRRIEADEARRLVLEQRAPGATDPATDLELAAIDQRLNMDTQFVGVIQGLLASPKANKDTWAAVAKLCAYAHRDLARAALERCVEAEPTNHLVLIELAATEMALGKPDDALATVQQAVEIGGEPAREKLRYDSRFDPLREKAEFKAVVPSSSSWPFAP